ncbi:hypothetical protein BDB01DRAFT_843847 [Pilobolus umbonatus]|nr:hypothetical protein BDB01DRAFT_843847 [Pilobolus umbonatus]
MRVGAAQLLVPDASAENPLIISIKEDQPLCSPDTILTPSSELTVMPGYALSVIVNTIQNPKRMIVDRANHILVVSSDGLYSVRMDKCGNTQTQLILGNDMSIHGLALYDHQLYLTTADSVYKYPYSDGQHSPLENGEIVIRNINSEQAPDIVISPFGHVYIPQTVKTVDDKVTPSDAIIKKFNLRLMFDSGFDFNEDGELYALGTNTRGSLGFDAQMKLWGISRFDETSSMDWNQGLAEELNVYDTANKNYGFPYCNTQGVQSEGYRQSAHPSFTKDSTDEYCRNSANNQPPAVPLPSNSIASALHFFMGTFCSMGDSETLGTSVGLPCNWTNTPLIANRGMDGMSVGHNVVRIPFDDLGHKPRLDKEVEVLIQHAEPCDTGCITPHSLAVDTYGRLLITSDQTNEIFLFSRIYEQQAAQMLTDKYNVEVGEDED